MRCSICADGFPLRSAIRPARPRPISASRLGSPRDKFGLPNFIIVGLTDRAIQEARERVRASIRNACFEFPQRRLTVNLAPAEVPKEGTGFDLTIRLPAPYIGQDRVRPCHAP
jgi:hypothetical protein